MGQKVNPIIFRLGKTKNWSSKYFAKKTPEISIYAFKDLEIRKFIDKFFKNNGLTVSNCKINYSDDGLHIFVSYYLTFKSPFLANKLIKKQKINLVKIRRRKNGKMIKKYRRVTRKVKNYVKYQSIKRGKIFKKVVQKKNRKRVVNSIIMEREALKIRRIKLLKSYKSFLALKNLIKFNSIEANSFTTKFFNSLHFFFNKNIKIFLTLHQLNKNVQQNTNKDKIKFFKKSLIKLGKYKQNKFFREGLNILFLSTTKAQTANLLTQFISTQLSKFKRHNFFLKFLKTTLTLFKNTKFSNIKGMKIKIKGRLNGRPRARHKIITIGSGVPAITLNSNIDYSESTAYTSNGTLGVKVWISQN